MDAHPNFAYSTVAVAPSPAASGTTLTVAAGDGALFSTFPFDATVWPINTQPTVSNAEIVRITGRAGDVLTIQRAVEGSSARTIVVGDQIAVVASKKVFTDIEAAIPSIAASNTTYTSGTISVTGVGGGVTVASNTGQRIDISVAAPVAQSVQPETKTFLGAISPSDTLYTSGTVRLTGVGGGVTVSSNTGQRVDISVAAPVAQTVQTQNAVDVTLAGNTAGALALISSGTMTLAGGNNITVSQAGNAVTISGPAAGGAQTAISVLGNSQTTYTSGTVNLSVVAGNLTIRSTTGQAFQFSASQSVQAETQTFVGGLVGSNATYTSGTVTITGVGGGITVSSNTGQRIDLSVAAQSVQPETQTFIGGISASNTLYTSGSVRFTGSNAATVKSGTGQLVVIDVPTQTTQVETQTFVGGIANSQTTYTSGTVSLSELGAITVRSTTGNQYQFSVNSQTVQTQDVLSVGASTGGNTSGNTTVNTGSRLVFVGSNNITISQGTAAGATTLTISGPSVAGAQTGISGIANSQTTYTSGTVSLSELGAVTIRSTTGQIYQVSVNSQTNQAGTVYASSNTFGTSSGTYDARSISIAGSGAVSVAASNSGWVISAPAQSVQTQDNLSIGISTGGNTLGNTTVNTGSRFVIVGSGNLTASQATAAGATTVTLSVAAGAAQTAISGLANSQTTYTSGTVSLSELGAITIRSTTGNQFQLSVNAQSVQPETQTFLAGAAASNTTYTSGTFTVTGVGGGVTVNSNTGQRIDISVAAPVAQTNQSGNVYASSNTFGTSSGTYDARSISIAGRGAVSVAASNSGWIVSAPAQTAETAISGLANSQTTYTSGTVSLSELGAITIRSTTGNQFQFSVAAQSVQAETQTFLGAIQNSQTTYTSGTVNLSVVAGNLTIRSTTGQALQFSMSQSVQAETQTAISGLANSQTTYTSGTVSLSELGAITIRSTTGNQFQLSVNSQTAQTQSNIQALYDGANSISTGTIRVTNANGVSFSVNAQTLSASVNESISMFAVSNTTQSSSGTAHKSALSFAGAGIASVGVTGGSVVVSVPSGGGAGDGGVFGGVSTMGNTAGSTGTVSTGNFVLVGTGPISLSQSTGAAGSAATISINAPATSSLSATGAVSLSTNGSTISVGAPNSSLISGTGQVSISTTGSTISIGVPNPQASYRWIEGPLQMGATQGIGNSGATNTTLTVWVQPVTIPTDLLYNNIAIAANLSFSSATTSISSINYSFSMGASLGFYSLSGSSMSLVTSHSGSLGYSNATAVAVGNMSITARVGMGGSSTTKSTQGGANLTNIQSSISGVRAIPLEWTSHGNTLTRGQYWLVAAVSALTAGANQASLSQVGFVSGYSAIGSALNPPDLMQNTASVTSPFPFLGLATLVASTNSLMPVSFNTSKVTTATAIANSTAFQSLWVRIFSSHSN